jgi:hypothetical protein
MAIVDRRWLLLQRATVIPMFTRMRNHLWSMLTAIDPTIPLRIDHQPITEEAVLGSSNLSHDIHYLQGFPRHPLMYSSLSERALAKIAAYNEQLLETPRATCVDSDTITRYERKHNMRLPFMGNTDNTILP